MRNKHTKPLQLFLTLPWEYFLEGQVGQRLDVFVDLTDRLGMLCFERSTLPALIQFLVPPKQLLTERGGSTLLQRKAEEE